MAIESSIERSVCKWAKDNGCLVIKQTSPNNRGVPDRLFLRDGKCLFIEFKRPGGKVSALQDKWIKELLAENIPAADRKSTRLNSSHVSESRMPSSA